MSWKKHFDRGMELGSQGDLEGAAVAFRKAVKANPKEPYPHYELGYTLCRLGRIQEGVEEFRTTNKLAEGFFLVQTELFIYESLLNGEVNEQTVELCREILKLNDMSQWTGGPDVSEKLDALARELLDIAPDFALSHFYYVKHAIGETFEGRRVLLERCLELGPDDTTAIYAKVYLGGFYERDNPDKSLRIWQEVIEGYPQNPHTKVCEVFVKQRSN